jgi:hypothetical protein
MAQNNVTMMGCLFGSRMHCGYKPESTDGFHLGPVVARVLHTNFQIKRGPTG